jgi:hypothetical protein
MHVKRISAVHVQTLRCEASASLLLSDCKSRGNMGLEKKKWRRPEYPSKKENALSTDQLVQ